MNEPADECPWCGSDLRWTIIAPDLVAGLVGPGVQLPPGPVRHWSCKRRKCGATGILALVLA